MIKCKNCNNDVRWGKHATEFELESQICPECYSRPYAITSVARADLQEAFTPEQIGMFDDSDMKRLADKMANAYAGGSFWIDIEIIGECILEDKK